MGPVTQNGDPDNRPVDNTCGDIDGDGIPNAKGNVLTFSGKHGTIVYTQMKVLEDLPITLTSPRIWEALGLPLTPFEDSINFFADPGKVDEDSIRPYVAMKAQLHYYDSTKSDGVGSAVFANNQPVIGFGTAPIDIPNCERCHSNGPEAPNSPQKNNVELTGIDQTWKDVQAALVDAEYEYWLSVYEGMQTGSDWYARLKSAAISMMYDHDAQHGTSFTACYPDSTDCDPLDLPDSKSKFPQNTRLGHESVICQKCHADNVIAVVKSACKDPLVDGACPPGSLIPPITEAIHRNHRSTTELDEDGVRGVIAFNDSLGRSGACQGCHPAHRSDGVMTEEGDDRYPITLDGANAFAGTNTAVDDNRLAAGGCFVGRDVHSNPYKESDGAGTPEHLNAVGEWLQTNVAMDTGEWRGIWCTNCHSQLGQEIWKKENMVDLIKGTPGPGATNIRALPSLGAIASAIGVSKQQAEAWLDPKDDHPLGDFTHAIWNPDPGLCAHVGVLFGDTPIPAMDGNVATIEVALPGQACSTGASADGPDCDEDNDPDFQICGTYDGDSDFSVNILDFCTTDDCVTTAQAKLSSSKAVPVPFSASPQPPTAATTGWRRVSRTARTAMRRPTWSRVAVSRTSATLRPSTIRARPA